MSRVGPAHFKPSFEAFYVVVPQQIFLHLAHRISWQRIKLDPPSRHLKSCQLLTTSGLECFHLKLVLTNQHSDNPFSKIRMRHANDGTLNNTVLIIQNVFNFFRIDIEPTRNDEIFATTHDRYVAVV